MSKITSLRTEGLPVERSEAIRLIEEIACPPLHCHIWQAGFVAPLRFAPRNDGFDFWTAFIREAS